MLPVEDVLTSFVAHHRLRRQKQFAAAVTKTVHVERCTEICPARQVRITEQTIGVNNWHHY